MTTPELQELLARAQALEPLTQYDEALQHLETVITRAQQQGLAAFQATALYHQAKILRIKGELGLAEQSARGAAELFSQAGDIAGQAQALLVLGEVFSDQAKLREFEQTCREAIAISQRAVEGTGVEARGLTLLGTALAYQGRADEARSYIEQSVGMYRTLGDQRGVATSLLMLGRIDHMRGRLEAATRSMQEAITVFERLNDRRAMASAYINLGMIDLERGELAQARGFAERGIAMTEAAGEIPMRLRCVLLLSQIEVEDGNWGSAVDRLRTAEEMCAAHGQQSALPEVLRVTAQAHLGSGAVEEAERFARRAREIVTEDDAFSQGTTRLVLSLVLERQGRTAEADDEFRMAVNQLEEAGEAFEVGWGHLSYGQFLTPLDRREEARQHLLQAREAFLSLEAQGRVAVIEDLLRRV